MLFLEKNGVVRYFIEKIYSLSSLSKFGMSMPLPSGPSTFLTEYFLLQVSQVRCVLSVLIISDDLPLHAGQQMRLLRRSGSSIFCF